MSFDLVEEGSKLGDPGTVGIGLAIGALTYFVLDRTVEHRFSGGGTSLALGAFLDGIPEQMVLGIGLAALKGGGHAAPPERTATSTGPLWRGS